MKNLLLSIQPQHTMNILNKDKTLEIRTTIPKEWKDYLSGKTKVKPEPMKCLIYCTKPKKRLTNFGYVYDSNRYIYGEHPFDELNGKVVAEFMLNEVEPFTVGSPKCDDIQKLACLTYEQMLDYFYKPEELDGNHIKWGYALHIDDLKIYDKPKELGEFKTLPCNKPESACRNCKYLEVVNTPNAYETNCYVMNGKQLTRPPQSWCYVEEIN